MEHATRELLSEMLRLFYEKGWVSGTGGGICGLEGPGRLLLAPTGVHKERVTPSDFFVVDSGGGRVVESPGDTSLRPSECGGVFRAMIRDRGAGAVMHSHSMSAVLAADMSGDTFTVRGLEMLKGIRGLSNTDTHLIPVIENTPTEPEIVGRVEEVLRDPRFTGAFAVLVRDHGAYVWGEDVWETKRHAEVYHWLFEAVRLRGA
jgi:methylthioribulose-1-phosphate dehydratase